MNKFLNLTKSTETSSLEISTRESVNRTWIHDLSKPVINICRWIIYEQKRLLNWAGGQFDGDNR